MDYFETASRLVADGTPFVSVTLVATTGSTPQDAGSKMLVTAAGRHFGTVGGGRLETRALDVALQMLRTARQTIQLVSYNLRRDLEMVCGGEATLFYEAVVPSAWSIAVFGAGHVAQKLVPLLAALPCRLTCLDTRTEWLDQLAQSGNLKRVHAADLPAQVNSLASGTFVVLMTMGHATDKPILIELLKRAGDSPYIGVIGSRAKAAELRKAVREAGLPQEAESQFVCPVGLPFGTNHLAEIAVSITAQLLQERDRYFSQKVEEPIQ